MRASVNQVCAISKNSGGRCADLRRAARPDSVLAAQKAAACQSRVCAPPAGRRRVLAALAGEARGRAADPARGGPARPPAWIPCSRPSIGLARSTLMQPGWHVDPPLSPRPCLPDSAHRITAPPYRTARCFPASLPDRVSSWPRSHRCEPRPAHSPSVCSLVARPSLSERCLPPCVILVTFVA